MLIVWDRVASDMLDVSTFNILHRYENTDLVSYRGSLQDLAHISYELTDNVPLHVNGMAVTVAAGVFECGKHPRTLLRFAGPIVRSWLRTLRAFKVSIQFWCPPYGVCVQLPGANTLYQLRERLPALVGAIPYTEAHCVRYEFTGSLSISATETPGQIKSWVDVVCFSQADRERLRAHFTKMSVRIIAQSKYKLRLEYNGVMHALREINGVKLVDKVQLPVTASTDMDEAIGVYQTYEDFDQDLNGSGQVIAVADTGFDRGIAGEGVHPDFNGRIRDISSWPIDDSWSEYIKKPGNDDGAADKNSGHGTHVAGLALGSGQASQGKHRGVAPGANLVFQAIEQFTSVKAMYADSIASGYYLSGRPMDIRDLFLDARQSGARIHVNAWGTSSRGAYTDDCYEADDFLYKHNDALVLFAAGNDGADRDGNRRIDAQSLFAPASAKNVIAIGATEGPESGVGLRGTWDTFNRTGNRRFRNSNDLSDRISGEPEHIALISSAGPTIDGRIKPDLCAPGTNLPAPRSQASKSRGWGLANPYPYYMYNGGTSMATGTAGGYFALLRQAWQQQSAGKAPSGPALKALAILAAQVVTQRDNALPEPQMISGFGRINLANALPGQANGIQLIDHQEPGLNTGESHTFPLRINQTQIFKAVLCWYDVPGEYLINDLDLRLEKRDGEILCYGNHAPGEVGRPDRINTVEVITLAALASGDYVLRVSAPNIPSGPQTYALVVKAAQQHRIDIPLEWIKGIGKAYATRLRHNNIEYLDDLLGLSLQSLQQVLNTKGMRVDALYSRLLILEERLETTITADIPAALRVSDLFLSEYSGISQASWRQITRRLLPLNEVFDRSKCKSVMLGELFKLQFKV